jgi:hypothetical protein
MLEFFVGTSLALFTYPLRIIIFAIIMGMFVVEEGLVKAIPLMGGFLFGFLLNTFLRGFRKLGAFRLS